VPSARDIRQHEDANYVYDNDDDDDVVVVVHGMLFQHG